jgi:hypothetical protein
MEAIAETAEQLCARHILGGGDSRPALPAFPLSIPMGNCTTYLFAIG